MKLSRQEAIDALLETDSMRMHGFGTKEIRTMTTGDLCKLINEIFEPIDIEDPYSVGETKIHVPASFAQTS